MSITLQGDQLDAFDSVIEFLFDREDTKCISGGSGTGKSVLISYIVQNILAKYKAMSTLMGLPVTIDKIVVLATTNSAANELEKKLHSLLSSNSGSVRTVHSYFGFRIEDDYSTGKTGVVGATDPNNHGFVLYNTLVIVDEASQLDGVIKRMMMRHLDSNSKLLLVGDKRQLLPVKGNMTTAFYQDNTTYLQTTRRTSHPALQALYAQLEQGVDHKSFAKINLLPGVIDWLSEDDAQEAIKEAFTTGTNSARVATYTDARSRVTNSYIRYVQGKPAEICVGDNLVVNSTGSARFPVGTPLTVTQLEPIEQKVFDDPQTLSYDNTPIIVPYRLAFVASGTSARKVAVPVDLDHFFNVMKFFAATKHWKAYFSLKKDFLDLRLPYAMTTYKLQGITTHTIFVDMTDLCSCKNQDTLARLLYVALTRASHRVVLYGSIPMRLRSLVEEITYTR